MQRLEGKEIVITGGTDGIGKVTARELAKMGASVTIVARNAAKAQAVIKDLRTAAGHDRVGFVRADLSTQKGVRGAAETIKGRLKRLDVLINNAGAMFSRRQLTDDGIEQTLALNHLAYFLLTNQLLDPAQGLGAVAGDQRRVGRAQRRQAADRRFAGDEIVLGLARLSALEARQYLFHL